MNANDIHDVSTPVVAASLVEDWVRDFEPSKHPTLKVAVIGSLSFLEAVTRFITRRFSGEVSFVSTLRSITLTDGTVITLSRSDDVLIGRSFDKIIYAEGFDVNPNRLFAALR